MKTGVGVEHKTDGENKSNVIISKKKEKGRLAEENLLRRQRVGRNRDIYQQLSKTRRKSREIWRSSMGNSNHTHEGYIIQ